MSSAAELIQASLIGEAIDGGPALVFVADEYMRYLAVNRHACEVLGYSREELLGLRVSDVAVAPDIDEVYAHMLKSTEVSGMTPLRCRDGTEVTFSFRAKETTAAGMTFWVTVGFVHEAD
jgi:PAS domain S-box-containing protein